MSVKKEMDTVDGPAKEGNSIQEVKWNCFLKSTVRGAVSLLRSEGRGSRYLLLFCRLVYGNDTEDAAIPRADFESCGTFALVLTYEASRFLCCRSLLQ